MARYGLPYQGSKSAIAEWIVANIPSDETFIDLFAGGCAVAHAAMVSRKWNRFIVNDINDTPLLFLDAVNGKYKNERRWISREDFSMLKDTDPYIASCWSFGNDRSTYLYSKEIEPYKKTVHELIFAETPHDRRLKYREVIKRLFDYLKTKKSTSLRSFQQLQSLGSLGSLQSLESLERLQRLQSLESLERLQRLQSLERLQRLQSLERLESLQRLQRLQKDYKTVEIPADAVVYCDIPYKNTDCRAYRGFDHDRFYNWLDNLPHLAVVSEITAPPNCVCVAEKEKDVLMSDKGNSGKRVEQLFVHKNYIDEYRERMAKEKQVKLF